MIKQIAPLLEIFLFKQIKFPPKIYRNKIFFEGSCLGSIVFHHSASIKSVICCIGGRLRKERKKRERSNGMIKKSNEMITIEKRYLNVCEVALYLGFSVSAVRKWVRQGMIPFNKVNGGIRFDIKRINKWVDQRY